MLTATTCILDVNGVLIDSNLPNARAMSAVFSSDPDKRFQIESIYLGLSGIDRGSKIRIVQERAIGRPFEEGEFELLWEEFRKRAHESMLSSPETPKCRVVLAELGRRGVTRIALSNTPAPELAEILSVRGLDSLLDIVRGGGDWPKSESLVRLIAEMQIDPESCIFLGDGKGDMFAARKAGVPFVAIGSGGSEFDGEKDIAGPYSGLAEWAEKTLGV